MVNLQVLTNIKIIFINNFTYTKKSRNCYYLKLVKWNVFNKNIISVMEKPKYERSYVYRTERMTINSNQSGTETFNVL